MHVFPPCETHTLTYHVGLTSPGAGRRHHRRPEVGGQTAWARPAAAGRNVVRRHPGQGCVHPAALSASSCCRKVSGSQTVSDVTWCRSDPPARSRCHAPPQPALPFPKCTGAYTEAVAAAAAQHEDFVMGFISISPSQWSGPAPSPGLIHMTPGVQLQVGALPHPPHAGVMSRVAMVPAAGCCMHHLNDTACCAVPPLR